MKKLHLLLIIAVAMIFINNNSKAQTSTNPPVIQTLGVNSTYSSSSLNTKGITMDNNGNLYVAEGGYIRKIEYQTGTEQTQPYLGNPNLFGYAGDATVNANVSQIKFSDPSNTEGICGLEYYNNTLYIVDRGNYCVRTYSSSGSMSLFAGIPGTNAAGANNVSAASTSLADPRFVAVDKRNGNIYISESGRIRKVNPSGVISTLVTISDPTNIAISSTGKMYINSNESDIQMIDLDATTPTLSTVVGGGPSSNASLNFTGNATSAYFLSNIYSMIWDNVHNYMYLFATDPSFGSYVGIKKVDFSVTTPQISTVVYGTNASTIGGGDGYSASQTTFSYAGLLPQAVIDECGNFIYADTYIGNMRAFYNNKLGNISHPTLGTIPDITVDITGDAKQTIVCEGDYYWSPRKGSGSYTITPSKPNIQNKLNGITTVDVALMKSVALCFNTVSSSAYGDQKTFAGDVTNDGLVSCIDIAMTQSMILGKMKHYPQNRDVIFLDKSKTFQRIDPNSNFDYGGQYVFRNCTNCTTPTNYQECFSKTISTSNCTLPSADFYILKVGDLNFDVTSPLSRQAPLTLYYDNIDISNVETGGEFIVPIKVKNFKDILTAQFSFDFNPDNLRLQVVENVIDSLVFNDEQKTSGKLSFSWYDTTIQGSTLADGSVIFNLRFTKVKSVKSQDIVLTSDLTPVEVSNKNFELVPLEKQLCKIYDYSTGAVDDSQDSWEIIPPYSTKGNLFVDVLNRSGAGTVQMQVLDSRFELIYQTTRQLVSGENILYSNLRSQLNLPSGIYYVSLVGLNTTDTKTFYVGAIDDVETPDNIAAGTINVPSSNATATQEALQTNLYCDFKTNTSLQSDSLLQVFENYSSSSNKQTIFAVDSIISSGDLNSAATILSSWTTSTTIEANYKNYYGWVLAVANSGVGAIDSTTFSAIYDLANSCPLTSGYVVYSARDLYNSLVQDNLVFEDVCPLSTGRSSKSNNSTTPAIAPWPIRANNSNKILLNNSGKLIAASNSKLFVYPNPSNGIVNIQLPAAETSSKTIQVTDAFGKLIMEQQTQKGESNVSLNIKASSGVYFLKVMDTQTGKTSIQKIVLNK